MQPVSGLEGGNVVERIDSRPHARVEETDGAGADEQLDVAKAGALERVRKAAATRLGDVARAEVAAADGGAQAQIVDSLIHDLGAEGIPCIRVYNKSDLFYGDLRPRGERMVNISAKTGEGLDELLRAIDAELDKGTRRVTIHLPYDKGGLLDSLYREAKVESVDYGETIDIVAVCTPRVLGQVKAYVEGYTEPKEDWEE